MFNPTAETIIIPLRPIPSQDFQILIGAQGCRLKIYQKDSDVYCDLSVDDIAIWAGILCVLDVGIKPAQYLGFKGNLFFRDLQGNSDPNFTGFGTRWFLEYVEQENA